MPALEIVRVIAPGRTIPWMRGRATAAGHPVLAVWQDAEPAILLGRFHATAPGVPARRRATGGRIVPTGPGLVRLALALPHRSALESDDPHALRPEQAMNRCVRGVLEACRRSGVDAFYPGRDVVTAIGAPIAWLSLIDEPAGGALFEAGVAVTSALDDLPESLPPGAVPPHWGPRRPETLAGSHAGGLAPSALVAALLDAYAARASDVCDVELDEGQVETAPAPEWTVPAQADRVGDVPGMLGRVRAHVGIDGTHRLAAVRLSGDVIAPIAAMHAIERALHGVPALRSEIERAVGTALADPAHWVLGIDGPADVAGAVLEAIA